jgi:hypothetical protein
MAFRAVVDTQDVDMGYGAIIKELHNLQNLALLVGFQEGSQTHSQSQGNRKKEGGLSMPEIAAKNEFGDRGVPARPFMSTSFDENRKQIQSFIETYQSEVFTGRMTAKQMVGNLGQDLVRIVQQKIYQIQYPPNSPRTIAIKKSSKPLIDFGQMVNAVTYKIVKK